MGKRIRGIDEKRGFEFSFFDMFRKDLSNKSDDSGAQSFDPLALGGRNRDLAGKDAMKARIILMQANEPKYQSTDNVINFQAPRKSVGRICQHGFPSGQMPVDDHCQNGLFVREVFVDGPERLFQQRAGWRVRVRR